MIKTMYINDGLIQISSDKQAKTRQIRSRLEKRDIFFVAFGKSLFIRQVDFNKDGLIQLTK